MQTDKLNLEIGHDIYEESSRNREKFYIDMLKKSRDDICLINNEVVRISKLEKIDNESNLLNNRDDNLNSHIKKGFNYIMCRLFIILNT